MSEIRTAPVKATFVPHDAFFDEEMRTKVPGSLCVAPDDEQEAGKPWTRWYYACPCGCGAAGALRVQAGEKPSHSPSWMWNGSRDAPTLTPSVYFVGHWHGWLRNGVWESC